MGHLTRYGMFSVNKRLIHSLDPVFQTFIARYPQPKVISRDCGRGRGSPDHHRDVSLKIRLEQSLNARVLSST
ncbi:hypothetical protein TNCV_3312681 [Trichonephila clavipes]|nr:hypothetical protein TNCV_3312681 [Trichonephila clavipes]